MSGHSKWSTIKHKKGAADAKRGKIFTKHAKLIQMAAKEGGSGDPDMNSALRVAIENAKAENVPNANIERAIKKGTGAEKADDIAEVTYECYAPGGSACIIECLTDNKNRTLNNVRSGIEKKGGKWAESGSVSFMFTRKGVVIAEGERTDDLELALMDCNAEEIEVDDNLITVTTDAASWAKARDVLKEHGCEMQEAGLKYVANQTVAIEDADAAKKLMDFIEGIEEDDDVNEVHTNADIDDSIASQL